MLKQFASNTTLPSAITINHVTFSGSMPITILITLASLQISYTLLIKLSISYSHVNVKFLSKTIFCSSGVVIPTLTSVGKDSDIT